MTASPLEVPLKWPASQMRGDGGGRVVAEVTCSGPSRHLSTRCMPNCRCRRQASRPARTNSRTARVASAPTTAPTVSSDSAGRRLLTVTGRRRVRGSSSSLCDFPVNTRHVLRHCRTDETPTQPPTLCGTENEYLCGWGVKGKMAHSILG